MYNELMPSRNSVKQFQEEGLYHVYNRGVGKAPIFLDEQDYTAFMRRLELMLLAEREAAQSQHNKQRIRIGNYSGRVRLVAFCLMPNHFHLMLWQTDQTAITEFMRTLCTSYGMYFNRKYDRVGPVFQGRFKAILVDSDTYSTHLSRYIHCNPMDLGLDVYTYRYSSLQYYFAPLYPKWLAPQFLENQFSSKAEYHRFVNDLSDMQTTEEQYGLD